MDLINTLLISSMVINTLVAVIVFSRRDGTDSTVFIALTTNIILWTLAMVVFRQTAGTPPILSLALHLLYAIPLFIPVLFWHFVCLFTKALPTLRRWAPAIYGYTLVFAVVTLVSDAVVFHPLASIIGEKTFSFGFLYPLYVVHFLLFFPLAFLLLCQAYLKSEDRPFKRSALSIFSGVLASVTIGLMGNLLLPWFGIFRFDWIANLSSILYICVIMYAIVQYRLFNIKVVAIEFLSAFLVGFLIVDLFFSQVKTAPYVGPMFLTLIALISALQVRGVYREIAQREVIEKQEKDLEIANAGQVNLIHILNHQIKGFLTKGRNTISEVLDGVYGPVPEKAKPILSEGLDALTEGVQFTTQLLNVSSVANGTMRYTMAPMDLRAVVEEVAAAEKERADKKGLALTVEIADGSYQMAGDAVQLREVVKNLVGNAIIYTPSGSVTVSLSRKADRLVLAVKDTGVGLTPRGQGEAVHGGRARQRGVQDQPGEHGVWVQLYPIVGLGAES